MHDLSTFLVTIEIKDDNATINPPSAPSTGTQLHSWMTQFTTFHADATILTKNGAKLTIANFPKNEADLYEMFKYEISPRRNRNVTVLVEIESTQSFNELKIL